MINKKEYDKLKEINIDNEDYEFWDLRSNLDVHYVINPLFAESKSLRRFLYNENLHGERLIDKEDFKIPAAFRDHDYVVKINPYMNENFFGPFYGFSLEGVMTFPYQFFEDFETLQKELGREWEAYVINPCLMRYGSALGIFITRNLKYEDVVSDINGYVQTKTGYKLFYKYTTGDIDEIRQEFVERNFNKFCEFFNGGEYPIMFKKLIHFWHDNICINCKEFESMYRYYENGLSFMLFDGINFQVLESVTPFMLVNTRTGWNSGGLYHLEFDTHFKCAYIGGGKRIEFSDEDLQDLKAGNFNFKLIEE